MHESRVTLVGIPVAMDSTEKPAPSSAELECTLQLVRSTMPPHTWKPPPLPSSRADPTCSKGATLAAIVLERMVAVVRDIT